MAHSPSDLQVKTFQIHTSADEQAVNEFLAGKVVRHWSASFSPASSQPAADGSPLVLGVWNIFVAYEPRMAQHSEHESHDHGPQNRNERKPQQRGREAQLPRQATAPPARSEKAVVEDYKPQVPDADFPLFDAVRKWRNTRAREARVKPYSFFNNRQLEQIVTAKPESADSLKAIATDMSPELWDKYHNELLAFIDTARGASGGSAILSSEPSAAETAA